MAATEKVRQIQLVGQKIRQLRKERKLTQVELSQRLGIQQSDLSRMEQGEYRFSLDTLFRILAEFKMSIGEFFEDVASVAVPIRDYTRSVVGSLAVAGPAYRISGERINIELAPLILEAGRELSHRLGYNV